MEKRNTLNLHEITQRMEELELLLEKSVDPETGEIKDVELLIHLETWGATRDEKIINCARYIQQHKEIAGSYAVHIKRLQARAKQHQAEAGFLKTWVESACNSDEHFEAPDVGKVSFRKSERVETFDISLVPRELVTTYEAPADTLDKQSAKKWRKEHQGECPPGVTFTQHKSLQIK